MPRPNGISWFQVNRRIDRAHLRIVEEIKATQIRVYTPEERAALFPDGYDMSQVNTTLHDVYTEERAIGINTLHESFSPHTDLTKNLFGNSRWE